MIIHTLRYLRRAAAATGALRGADTLFLSRNRALTATIAQLNHHLKLITWNLGGTSKLDRLTLARAFALVRARLYLTRATSSVV